MEVVSIESFLNYFDNVRARTMRAVSAIPAEKLEWRHSPDVFSPGDLARHIAATERWTFTENIFGRPSRYPGCGADLAAGLENVVAYMERMHAEAVALLGQLRPEQVQTKGVTPQGAPASISKLLRAMIEHEVHHRGEIYVYLALLGVDRPPLYGVTEPELRRHSIA